MSLDCPLCHDAGWRPAISEGRGPGVKRGWNLAPACRLWGSSVSPSADAQLTWGLGGLLDPQARTEERDRPWSCQFGTAALTTIPLSALTQF